MTQAIQSHASARPTALVTGGAQRIGAAIVRELHRRGFTIALHYRSSADAAEALADSLNRERPDSCRCYRADLTSLGEIEALAAKVSTHLKTGLQLLVNNASSFEPTPFGEAQEADFDAMLASNLKGPFFLTQALLPLLRTGQGNIVNIIDTHVQRPLNRFSAYCAAKAGLESLTRSLALELGPDIRVNGVAPGAILWPEDDTAYDSASREAMLARTPLQRLGDPEDIARAVAFLATEAPFITGQVIAVDGGRLLG